MELRPGYKQTEVGVIPEEWDAGRLEEYFSFISYGFTNPMPTVEHGIYLITAADIGDGRIQFDTARHTTEIAYRTLLSPKSMPKKNDILLTKDGSLGRLALVGDEVICINQSVAVIRPNEKVDPIFLKMLLESPSCQKKMLEDAGGSTIKHIYITIVNLMPIAVPKSRTEQYAIAGALGDVDALIGALDRLIVKKRDLKQAAMQQLLTGQTRLPGFSGEWEVKRLGNICKITTGKKDVNEGNPQGPYPFFTCSRRYTFSDSYSFDAEAILIAGNGDVGTLHYYKGKFEAYQRTYVLSSFATSVDHLYHYLEKTLIPSLVVDKIGSSIPYIKLGNLKDLMIILPKDATETKAIAAVLSDMDAEIAALEARRDKTRDLKQGMMQELLTGRTRLV